MSGASGIADHFGDTSPADDEPTSRDRNGIARRARARGNQIHLQPNSSLRSRVLRLNYTSPPTPAAQFHAMPLHETILAGVTATLLVLLPVFLAWYALYHFIFRHNYAVQEIFGLPRTPQTVVPEGFDRKPQAGRGKARKARKAD